MKKIIATILAASLMLVATEAFAQIHVGAGYVSSTLSGQYKGNAQDPEASNGFYAGGSFNIPLSVATPNLVVADGLCVSLLLGLGWRMVFDAGK